MPKDFSAHDAELDALGREPSHLADLVAQYAEHGAADLGHVDALLDALGEAVAAPRMDESEAPATVEQPLDEQGPASGEYSLGPEGTAPTESGDLDVSGEMTLTEERSGSFELPTAPADDGASEDPAGAMAEALHSQTPEGPDTEQVHLDAFEDEGEHTMVGAPPDVTQVVPTDTLVDDDLEIPEQESPSQEVTVRGHEGSDLDMLFDELTNPSSAPPPSSSSQALGGAGIQPGTEAEDPGAEATEDDLARFRGNASAPPSEDGYQDDEATAVFDADQFRDLEDDLGSEDHGLHDEVTRNVSSNPPPMPDDAVAVEAGSPTGGVPTQVDEAEDWAEELSMADLEIEEIESSELEVMVDADDAVGGAPPAARGSTPPPPPASAQPPLPEGDEGELQVELDADGETLDGGRPSLIGRLLGRKKKD